MASKCCGKANLSAGIPRHTQRQEACSRDKEMSVCLLQNALHQGVASKEYKRFLFKIECSSWVILLCS